MKGIVIFLICFILCIVASGQYVPDVDSLKERLSKYKIVDDKRARLLLNLAFYCKSSDGLQYAHQAIDISREINNIEYEALAWQYLSDNHRRMGNYMEANNCLITSSELFKKIGMEDKESTIYFLLGTNFSANKDFVNAQKYFSKCIPIIKSQNDSLQLASVYLNVGETFRLIGQLDSAEVYLIDALKTYEKFDQVGDKVIAIGNLGLVHLAQNKRDQAKSEVRYAIEKSILLEDPYLISYFQSEMAEIYLKEGNFKEGKDLLKESFNVANNASLKEQIRDISLKLAVLYENERNYKEALLFQKNFKLYDDSLKNVDNVRAMEQQQSRFEQSKLEEQINTLNRINKLQKRTSIILTSGISIFIILSFLLFRIYKIARRANVEITSQKKLVEKRENEKALLLKELNHRVKNNLQMVASLLNLQARQLKGHPAAEALISCKYRVEALTLMHRKLYREDVDTNIDLKDYVEELANNLVMNFGQEYQLKLDLESFRMNIDKAIPLGLIINELITNSLKYAKPEKEFPVLSVSVKNSIDKITLSIADNGRGLPEGFDWRSSSSFGLKLVHSLVSQLEAEIDYEGDNGSKWILTLDRLKLT